MTVANRVLEPTSAADAATMLAEAAAAGTPVVPVGTGSRLNVSRIQGPAVAFSSRRLTSGFAHYAGDLVATLPAGMRLADANIALGAERQWLPIDPLTGIQTTIGGLVASNDSGPRRHGFGSPRDLVIGMEVALTTGVVAHSGGRVVKNVAGYDLGRLFCGSLGSLGVITSVTFKLAPLPSASRTVVARFATPAAAVAAALRLWKSPLTPSCLEVTGPEPRLLVRFETTASSGHRMAASSTQMLDDGVDVRTVTEADEAAIWSAHHEAFAIAPVILKIVVLPNAVATMLTAAIALYPTCPISARPALGVIDIAVQDMNAVAPLTRAARECGGHVGVTRGDLRMAPDAGVTRVMNAVKQQFDPAGILPRPWEQA
ncbi:MAG: FAD-binding oxidoreductase [Vicinamibacterales bacterium]